MLPDSMVLSFEFVDGIVKCEAIYYNELRMKLDLIIFWEISYV